MYFALNEQQRALQDSVRDLAGRRLTLVSLERGANPQAQLKLEALP